MAVLLDVQGTEQHTGSGLSTVTFTGATSVITVGSGTNRALVLLIMFQSWTTAPTAVTVTWNGVSMTQLTSIADTPHTSNGFIFGLRNPASGANSIVVSWTNLADVHIQGVSFTGVDQTSDATAFPSASRVTNSGTGTVSTVNVPSATGDMVVEFTQTEGAGTGNLTSLVNDTGTATDNFLGQRGAGSTTVTPTWTWTGSNTWFTQAIDVAQVSAGDVLMAQIVM